MAASDLFTLAQIADQVCLNYGDTSDFTQAKARKWVNRALLRFSELGDWSWQRVYAQTFATVASTEAYSVAGIKAITKVFLASPIQRDLDLIEDRLFRQIFPNNTATGTPCYYREYGWSLTTVNTRKIALYPIPDAVYTVNYDGVRAIQLLTSDTEDVRTSTGMPQHLVDLLIEMATAVGFKELDDEQAKAQMDECLTRLGAAYFNDQTNIDDRIIMAPDYSLARNLDPVLPPQYNG